MGEGRGGRGFCFDLLAHASTVTPRPRACRPTQAHPQVGQVGQEDVHVDAVRRSALVVAKAVIHHGGAVPPRLVLLWRVRMGHQERRLGGEVLIQLTLPCLRRKDKTYLKGWLIIISEPNLYFGCKWNVIKKITMMFFWGDFTLF
jgi:hypothetical protein